MPNTDYENLLFEHNVYDAWQFVQNTNKLLAYAQYSKDVITNLIVQIGDRHNQWQEKTLTALNEQKQISINLDDLPQNTITVVGITVDAHFLLGKLTKDFFQYCRNAFDSMGQVANAALLANKRKRVDSTDFPKMKTTFAQHTYSTVFPSMHNWFQNISSSPEFEYIDTFNNRTKHTLDVYLKFLMDMFGDGKTAEISPFYRKEVQVEKRDMSSYFALILEFVVSSFDEFLQVLEVECVKDVYNTNRYNQLLVKQQKMNSDPKSDYSVVYIEDQAEFSSLPDEIFILLIKKYDDGSIASRNCPIDKVLIGDREYHYSGRYVAETPIGDDAMVMYRKYIKDTEVTGMAVFIEEARKPPTFYHNNPYMNITTTSDDEQFLIRCQIPL